MPLNFNWFRMSPMNSRCFVFFWWLLPACLVFGDPRHASIDPPFLAPVEEDAAKSLAEKDGPRILAVPSEEWLLHKTADGLHPDGNEQQMVWLMNRARTSPRLEGLYLADTGRDNVDNAVSFFSVNIELMKSEFAAIAPRPPAAFDRRIYEGSKVHSDDLIARMTQDHFMQFERVEAAGFDLNGGNASVYSFARDPVHAHAAFNIDWGGDDGTGMQTGRGHRDGIMGETLNTTNVGIAMVPESSEGNPVGPLVTSIVYARAGFAADHYNRFLVGTVWTDANGNDFYDPGEGLDGVNITPNRGQFFAVTADSGGWAIPATEAGDYIVTFSGGDLSEPQQRMVTVGTENVLVLWNDFDSFLGPPPVAVVIRIEKITTGGSFSWIGDEAHDYQLQTSSDLDMWENDDRAVTVDGSTMTVTFDDAELAGSLFVRVLSTRKP